MRASAQKHFKTLARDAWCDFGRRRGSTPDLQGHLSVSQGLGTIRFATLLRHRSSLSLKASPTRLLKAPQERPSSLRELSHPSPNCPGSRPPRAVPPMSGTKSVASFDSRLPFLLLVSCHCRRGPPRPGAPGFLNPVGAAAALFAVWPSAALCRPGRCERSLVLAGPRVPLNQVEVSLQRAG